MIGFFTDLDNTLIYSYKHDIGIDKKCVEIYNDREISYATSFTLNLIKELNKSIMIIPTSTRTVEQFNRINLGVKFKYTLVCNGGVLLIDGIRDEHWYRESLELVKHTIPQINKAIDYLINDKRINFELRYIENLFLFTKGREAKTVVSDLQNILDNSLVRVFNSGEKIYVVPNNLSKGRAIKRFLEIVNFEKTISAGDSEFDLSMVTTTDFGFIPNLFPIQLQTTSNLYQAHKNMIFSDELLENVKALSNTNMSDS